MKHAYTKKPLSWCGNVSKVIRKKYYNAHVRLNELVMVRISKKNNKIYG